MLHKLIASAILLNVNRKITFIENIARNTIRIVRFQSLIYFFEEGSVLGSRVIDSSCSKHLRDVKGLGLYTRNKKRIGVNVTLMSHTIDQKSLETLLYTHTSHAKPYSVGASFARAGVCQAQALIETVCSP